MKAQVIIAIVLLAVSGSAFASNSPKKLPCEQGAMGPNDKWPLVADTKRAEKPKTIFQIDGKAKQ